MLVHIYTRHSPSCPQTDPGYKRCRCLRWVSYTFQGVQHRESTKARTWEQAVQFARGVELRYARIEAGEKPKAREPATVAQAVAAYLEDKRSQHIAPVTLQKLKHWFEGQLLKWCAETGIHFLSDLNLNHLRQWRSTWKDGPLSSQKKQERLRGFLNFCQASGWIMENPARGLSKIKVTQRPTDVFTEDEFEYIVVTCGWIPNGKNLRALVLLMRWSGLSIRDAVTLEQARLNDQNQIFLYRAKTGTPVHVTIPPEVALELRMLPRINGGRYFFWTGNGTAKSVASQWQRSLRRLFSAVNLRHADGTPKRAHSHMLRDTFAVSLLLHGVPLHDVSILLGHTSVKTTEKHYAPFVHARMERLDEQVKATWKPNTLIKI